MIPLVPGSQPFQNGRSLCGRWLLDRDPSKPAFQRGVLLDVGAELLIGGRPDELQLPPRQHRFQDAGRVDGTFCRTCAHNGVKFVHKQDRAAIPHQLLQQIFEPLLKIPPVLGAGHKACHIQRKEPPPQQHPGHLFVRDPLCQPLGQCRLADAGFAHQTGVVFLAAAKDLHHPIQLFFPAEHRVQLTVGRPAGQVAAVFVAGAAPPRHGRGRPRLERQDELPGKLAALPHCVGQRHAQRRQQDARRAVGILQNGAEQVLRLRFGQPGVLCPDEGIIHGTAQIRSQRILFQPDCRGSAVFRYLPPHIQL